MTHPPIAKWITDMYSIDQKLRKQARPGYGILNFLIYAIDGIHQYRIWRMIQTHGYPTEQMIGKRALHHFWLLVQHQDYDLVLQENCLTQCGFSPKDTAYLTDRIRVSQGKKQIYGTQFKRVEKKIILKPTENRKLLNERRKRVGLAFEKSIEEMNRQDVKISKRREFN